MRNSLLPIDLNPRTKVWAPRDLKIYHNSEYRYAISPIAVALFRDKGGRRIKRTSKPLSMIFASLTHCLNTKASGKYFAREDGRWSRPDTMIRWPDPLVPAGTFLGGDTGRRPALPMAEFRYLSIPPLRYGLVLRTLLPPKTPRAAAEGRDKLPDVSPPYQAKNNHSPQSIYSPSFLRAAITRGSTSGREHLAPLS